MQLKEAVVRAALVWEVGIAAAVVVHQKIMVETAVPQMEDRVQHPFPLLRLLDQVAWLALVQVSLVAQDQPLNQ